MSQRYKIRLEDRWRVSAAGSDRVTLELRFLPFVEGARISHLLGQELARREFSHCGGATWEKRIGEHLLSIDAEFATATLSGEFSHIVDASAEVEGTLDECGDTRELAEAQLREQLEDQLEHAVREEESQKRRELGADLQRELSRLEPELNRIVDAVTIDALKEKAAQLGTIESIDEDRDSGSISLVIEL